MKTGILMSLVAGAVLAAAAGTLRAADPDFGPNVLVIDTNTPDAQSKVTAIYKAQEKAQFGKERNAILIKPGTYSLAIGVGFNTSVSGLGVTPDEVNVTSIDANAGWFGGNATCNFWRSVENFTCSPTGGKPYVKWAVSQATAFRRMHIKGNVNLFDGGNSSGGYIADSKIDGNVIAGSQQQWISRNAEWSAWNGAVWNYVFVGVKNPPAGSWPGKPYTVVDKTPVVREKPYLAIEGGSWVVIVPQLKKDSVGTDWTEKGKRIPLSDFFIMHEKDTAATVNAELAKGKNLLITPGVYHLEDSIKVTKADTVVMGMGYATILPENGTPAFTVADVDGVTICSLLIESGKKTSPTLIEVGPKGSSAKHDANPSLLADIFTRTGGFGPGSTETFITLNSNNVITDNFWLWRADHGPGQGWNSNPVKNGLVVNGNNVTCYGLFVEHTEEYQVLWNGENGRTYFFQCEIPYDPPKDWKSPSGRRGYAGYKVADTVKNHEAWGLGVYAFGGAYADTAIEIPDAAGVKIHHALTFGKGVSHIINEKAGGRGSGGTSSLPD